MATNPAAPNWVTFTNLTFVGVGSYTTIKLPTTNGTTGIFRTVAQ